MKTTLKLSFRRPLFALLPLLLVVSSVSAAPRAGVAVAYTWQLVPGESSIYISDFFQICTNDAGECAFVARGKLGSSTYFDYILSNGGLGRTAVPVKIREIDGTLLCLQNSGVVHSTDSGTLFAGADAITIPGVSSEDVRAVALAEGTAAFVASYQNSFDAARSGLIYRYSDQVLTLRASSDYLDSTFAAAGGGAGAAFVRGPEGFDQAEAFILPASLTKLRYDKARSAAVASNGHAVLNVNVLVSPLTSRTAKQTLFRKPKTALGATEITRAGGSFAGVTIADTPSPFSQFAVETSAVAVFLAQISTPTGNGVFRGGATSAALLKTGDAAPGITGATIGRVTSFALDDGGNCVIHATTKGPGTTTGEALFRSTSGSAAVLFARTGDTITVDGQTKTITGFGLQSVLNKGVSTGPRVMAPNGRVAAYVKFGNERAAFVFDAQ